MDSYGEFIKCVVIIVFMKYFGRVGVYVYVFVIVEFFLLSEFRVWFGY